jgi:hypothetical protein
MARLLWIAFITTSLILFAGCATQRLEGGFQEVASKLVAMGPADRAMNMGANGKVYEEKYGIYYDSITDALYTKTASGEREYILKGDLARAMFLIDNKEKE